jgi:ubiquinone/menaquinone biosynthesis C-methylase UbiE
MAVSNTRNKSEKEWESQEVAQNYHSRRAMREAWYRVATERMVQLAKVQGGARVLDVAAGTGEQTLVAARVVGPSGYVLAIDISASMLSVATQAAREAGLANVEMRVMDAQNLDVSDDSFDAVICRLGLMLFPNPVRALMEMHRAVRPGGHVVTMVFSTADKNPYFGVPLGLLSHRGLEVQPLFSLGTPEKLQETFKASGLRNVAIHEFAVRRTFSSIGEAIRNMEGMIAIRKPMASLSDAERQKFLAEVEQELSFHAQGGHCEIPGEMLAGVGEK